METHSSLRTLAADVRGNAPTRLPNNRKVRAPTNAKLALPM
jgi:hypothetical protein